MKLDNRFCVEVMSKSHVRDIFIFDTLAECTEFIKSLDLDIVDYVIIVSLF